MTRPAWQGSTRRWRLPKDWPKRRKRVLRRDDYRCRIRYEDICVGDATEVDHVERGDDHRLENLQAACQPCHARKTWRESHPPRVRPAEPHPGEVWGGGDPPVGRPGRPTR